MEAMPRSAHLIDTHSPRSEQPDQVNDRRRQCLVYKRRRAMNRIRFSTLLYVVLLLALAACQPQAAPLPTATSLPPTAIPSAKAPTAIPSTPAPATATAIPQAKNPVLVEHTIPTSQTDPGGIVAGPDGALWFVETAANKIGRISTDGVVTEYSVPTAGAIDRDQGFIAIGPDGALWFNEDLVNKVGRITTT